MSDSDKFEELAIRRFSVELPRPIVKQNLLAALAPVMREAAELAEGMQIHGCDVLRSCVLKNPIVDPKISMENLAKKIDRLRPISDLLTSQFDYEDSSSFEMVGLAFATLLDRMVSMAVYVHAAGQYATQPTQEDPGAFATKPVSGTYGVS